MRPAVWGAASAMVLGLAVQATADIYRYRDRSGTLVFTNAPAAPSARLMRELPPASRMLVPMTREALRAALAKPLPRVVPTSYDRLIREIAAHKARTRTVEDSSGVPPIAETQEYLARVLRDRLAYLRDRAGVLARR